MGDDHVHVLEAFSNGLISRREAIEALKLRDYAQLLVAQGDANLPMPLPPEEDIEEQAQTLVRLLQAHHD